MDNSIREFKSLSGEVVFGLVGFEDGEDFVEIMKTIDRVIHPTESDFSGITDMSGYFVKDGLRVEVEYDSMIGNNIVYKGEQSDELMSKVREWIKLIVHEIQDSRE